MTRLPIGPVTSPVPRFTTMGELAMAAGLAGRGLVLCWQDFPAPILCELWRHFAACAGPGRVLEVSSQADVRKVSERATELRLILVHSPRFHNPTAWAVQIGDPTAERASRPAIFSRFAPADPEEDPGNTLVLRSSTAECMAISQWLVAGPRGGFDCSAFPRPANVEVPCALMALLSPEHTAGRFGFRRFRDCQVLHSLLVGACVLCTAGQDTGPENPQTVSLEDYEQVRRLLQSRLVVAADQACDPLAADMVGRANIYISVKFGGDGDAGNPFCQCREESNVGPRQAVITRREIADLGNVHSRLVRRLVEFLRRRPDGYERFLAMGLVRRPPSRNAWRTSNYEELTGHLRSWSAK